MKKKQTVYAQETYRVQTGSVKMLDVTDINHTRRRCYTGLFSESRHTRESSDASAPPQSFGVQKKKIRTHTRKNPTPK